MISKTHSRRFNEDTHFINFKLINNDASCKKSKKIIIYRNIIFRSFDLQNNEG